MFVDDFPYVNLELAVAVLEQAQTALVADAHPAGLKRSARGHRLLPAIPKLLLGLSQADVHALRSVLQPAGKARMDLNTAKTNKPAQAAYEALGWVRDEEFYAYSKSVSK